MGCSSSRGVQIAQKPRRVDSMKSLSNSTIKIEPQNIYDEDFKIITTGTESICRVEDVNPIVCLGGSSFPIVTSNLFLDVDVPTNISLPIIAASRYGSGISIAIGHISMLLEQKLNMRDSEIFFTSLFHWAYSESRIQNESDESKIEQLLKIQSDNEDDEPSSFIDRSPQKNPESSKKALAIGFPQQHALDTKKFLRQFSISVEFASDSKFKSKYDKYDQLYDESDIDHFVLNEAFFNKYSMILAASNVCFDKVAIQNYVSKGGIFVALYIPPLLTRQIQSYCFNFFRIKNRRISSNPEYETAAFYIINEDNFSSSENILSNSSIDLSTSYSINDTLIQTNLAFTYCSLSIGDPNSLSFKIANKFNRISSINFPSLIDSYTNFLKEIQQAKDKNTSSYEERLDDLVTDLRFYLMVIENDIENAHYKEVKLLLNTTWNFLSLSCPLCNPHLLQSTQDDSKMDITVLHTICIVLLTQMLYSIPITEFSNSPLMSTCLGDVPEPEQIDDNSKNSNKTKKVKLSILPFSWVSTGLWLPRGAIGTVRCKKPMNFLHVQIGCHQTSLLEKKDQWKRWPVVVMLFSISSKETNFSSPFGGIVYIVSEMIPPKNQPIEVEFEFDGLYQYPYAIMNCPEKWKETSKNNFVSLWGEIESSNYIFTLPTYFLQKHENEIENYFQIFDKLFAEILQFTACQPKKPFRIVFDVDLIDNELDSISYPLVLSIDDIDKIFTIEKPTKELLNFLKSLSYVSFREGCIDSMTEDAVSLVSACHAIKSVWNDFDPLELVETDSLLFKALYDISQQYNKTIIPKTLSIFQNENFVSLDTQEDMWMQFVTELCNIGKKNFTNVLKKARPIPMNISSSIQSFQDFFN